jgi:cysteine desulfurase/selenocysteine lyase
MYEGARDKIRDFIGARESSEIVFTSGATEGLNWIVNSYFAKELKDGDEVLLTESEHASNILPWFKLSKDMGIVVKYIPLDENNEVTIDNIEKVLTERTKVISLAGITNVIGDTRPIKDICKLAHSKNILVVMDAAQSIAHSKIDVVDMDIDFMVFSGHKIYGPTGIGVMYGKFDLLEKMEPVNYGGGMNATFTNDGYMELRETPVKFEAGTQNIAGVIGLATSIDYINRIGIDKIRKYECELREYLVKRLLELDNIEIYNKNNKGSIVAFNIKDVFSQDTAVYLDKYNICVRAGNHCAKILNNVFNVNNTCRISLSFYNTYEEVDKLIEVLKNSDKIWEEIL